MKSFLLVTLLIALTSLCYSQQTDFIVLKKWNNRTVKTLAVGSFLSARTHNGFELNGFITAILNDSIYLRQQDTRLVGTEFGSVVDTVWYNLGLDYREIAVFNYKRDNAWRNKKGFAVITIPRLMLIGGVGFLALELINSAYRKESLSEHNKLPILAVAAGIAVAGYMIPRIQKNRNKAGGKYKVVYVKAGTIQLK